VCLTGVMLFINGGYPATAVVKQPWHVVPSRALFYMAGFKMRLGARFRQVDSIEFD